MKNKFENILIGINAENEFVFLDSIEFRNWNGYDEFSVVFSGSEPKILDEYEYEMQAESFLDCWDDAEKYSKCDYYDCPPSGLKNALMEDMTVEDCFDFDTTWSEEIQVKKDSEEYDVYICFAFSTPQSYDGEIVAYANEHIKELFELINETGKEYHLKKIPLDLWENLSTKLELYENRDTFKNDIEFMKNHLNLSDVTLV